MAARGDTSIVGAEARAVESGMVGGLGRVKERAPGGELPSRQYRKSFDEDHGSGTFWTAETSGWVGEVVAADGYGMGWSASSR